jgi:hypothetical protein
MNRTHKYNKMALGRIKDFAYRLSKSVIFGLDPKIFLTTKQLKIAKSKIF